MGGWAELSTGNRRRTFLTYFPSYPMMATTTSPELLLARRAAKADARAWDEIVARYGERIYNVAYRFSHNAADAEELTQDIFLKLYAKLHMYRGDVPLMAWALRLSRNVCIDHYRSHRLRLQARSVSEQQLMRLPSADDPHETSWHRQRRELVHRCLADMPEDQATVIMLRDLQGLSYDEVAHVLDVPSGTVKSRLNRARKELMERMREALADITPSSAPYSTREARRGS